MSQETVQEKEYTEVSDPAVMALTPLVSVLMITYNHGPYLADAIEGVIAQQTDFPIELLIGEDCSTDNTREVALDYQRRYPQLIRAIYSEKNVGMHENFRRIFSACRGKFIAFCEGDDYWVNPNKLQIQVNFLESHLEYGVTHGDFNYLIRCFGGWRQQNALNKIRGFDIPEGNIYKQLLDRMFIQTCTLCCRKEAIDEFLGSRHFKRKYAVLDWPLMIFISRYYKINYINKVLATYRRTPGSVMNSGPKIMLRRIIDSRKIYEDFYSTYKDINPWGDSQKKNYYMALYTVSFYANNETQFLEAQRWLAVYYPNHLKSMKHIIMKLLFNYRPVVNWIAKWIALKSEFEYWRCSE